MVKKVRFSDDCKDYDGCHEITKLCYEIINGFFNKPTIYHKRIGKSQKEIDDPDKKEDEYTANEERTALDMDDYEVNDKEFNYLVLGKNKIKIILNKYKTVKTYGSIDYEIDNKPLYNNIMKYYDGIQSYYKNNNKKFDGFLLFNIKNLEKLNRNQYTKYLTKLFEENTGKAISSSMIRKIISSNLVSPEFLEMAVKRQQHSASEAFKSYVKF